MFCDSYCTINDHEVPTKVSNSRIKCTNLGWDPERKCHIIYIHEIDHITQSLNANWNQRCFSSFGPASKSIVQARRELPHEARGAAQKAIDEGRAEQTRGRPSRRRSRSMPSPRASPRTLLPELKASPLRIRL